MSLEPRLEAKIKDLNLEIISIEAVYNFGAKLCECTFLVLLLTDCNCGQVNISLLYVRHLGIIISTTQGIVFIELIQAKCMELCLALSTH